MKKRRNSVNQTLQELLVGIVLIGILIQIICFLISNKVWYDSVGIWCGIGVACFMAIHMKRSIEDEVDIGALDAPAYARKAYAIRTVVALVVIGVVVYFQLGNPITIVIGIMSLKLSAYLQPTMHKGILKFLNKKGG